MECPLGLGWPLRPARKWAGHGGGSECLRLARGLLEECLCLRVWFCTSLSLAFCLGRKRKAGRFVWTLLPAVWECCSRKNCSRRHLSPDSRMLKVELNGLQGKASCQLQQRCALPQALLHRPYPPPGTARVTASDIGALQPHLHPHLQGTSPALSPPLFCLRLFRFQFALGIPDLWVPAGSCCVQLE